MFDLITGTTKRAPRHQTVPLLVSIAAHATIVGSVLLGTLVFIAAPVPHMDMISAFVAVPPPPPPPPAPAPAPPKASPKREVATSGDSAPVEAPIEIVAEPPGEDTSEEAMAGVEGGVPGGIPGGVLGGFVPEAPPPPPPPPVPHGPIRVGGVIKEPALIHRVEPVYPALAVARQLQGVVILEAMVDEEGRVESLKVLRSPGIFDDAAMDAVRQWRYSPVLLNGRPEKFVLTVVVSFRLVQ